MCRRPFLPLHALYLPCYGANNIYIVKPPSIFILHQLFLPSYTWNLPRSPTNYITILFTNLITLSSIIQLAEFEDLSLSINIGRRRCKQECIYRKHRHNNFVLFNNEWKIQHYKWNTSSTFSNWYQDRQWWKRRTTRKCLG